jgi:hypothetical protein
VSCHKQSEQIGEEIAKKKERRKITSRCFATWRKKTPVCFFALQLLIALKSQAFSGVFFTHATKKQNFFFRRQHPSPLYLTHLNIKKIIHHHIIMSKVELADDYMDDDEVVVDTSNSAAKK